PKALAEFLSRRREADPLHFPDLSLASVKLLVAGEYVVQIPGRTRSSASRRPHSQPVGSRGRGRRRPSSPRIGHPRGHSSSAFWRRTPTSRRIGPQRASGKRDQLVVEFGGMAAG